MMKKEYNGKLDAAGMSFGIVASRFNDLFTEQLLQGALDCLKRHGADEGKIAIARVPGAFEQPLVLKKMALCGQYDALIAIGVVIQGATSHAEHINSQLARAMTQISLETDTPVINGVVSAENLDQAIERCGTKAGNRGWNAAQSAIEMASLMKQFAKVK